MGEQDVRAGAVQHFLWINLTIFCTATPCCRQVLFANIEGTNIENPLTSLVLREVELKQGCDGDQMVSGLGLGRGIRFGKTGALGVKDWTVSGRIESAFRILGKHPGFLLVGG